MSARIPFWLFPRPSIQKTSCGATLLDLSHLGTKTSPLSGNENSGTGLPKQNGQRLVKQPLPITFSTSRSDEFSWRVCAIESRLNQSDREKAVPCCQGPELRTAETRRRRRTRRPN